MNGVDLSVIADWLVQQEMKRFDDALRIAENHIPSLTQRVHLEMAKCMDFDKEPRKQGFSDEMASALVQKGKAYEKGFDFSAAVDVYLTLDATTTSNHDLLCKACDLPDAADILFGR